MRFMLRLRPIGFIAKGAAPRHLGGKYVFSLTHDAMTFPNQLIFDHKCDVLLRPWACRMGAATQS
jgi:hypothetical protein